jgi:hypothetical protein
VISRWRRSYGRFFVACDDRRSGTTATLKPRMLVHGAKTLPAPARSKDRKQPRDQMPLYEASFGSFAGGTMEKALTSGQSRSSDITPQLELYAPEEASNKPLQRAGLLHVFQRRTRTASGNRESDMQSVPPLRPLPPGCAGHCPQLYGRPTKKVDEAYRRVDVRENPVF